MVKYDHYKKFEFKTESSIKYGGVDGQAAPATPPPPAKPKPAVS